MPHPELYESDDRLEVRSPMRPGMRVLLAALALFPLLAPYELIVKGEWENCLHWFVLPIAFISTGAIAPSAFLLFAAVVSVEVCERAWSDGAPSYHLGVAMADGMVFESGSSWSRGDIESIWARVEQSLSGTRV
jgi:hypothetical protein